MNKLDLRRDAPSFWSLDADAVEALEKHHDYRRFWNILFKSEPFIAFEKGR